MARRIDTGSTLVRDPRSNGDARWERLLVVTNNGIAASAGNVELILTNHPDWRQRIRCDVRSNVVTIERGTPISEGGDARTYRDSDDARVAIWLERSKYEMRISPSSAALTGAISVVAECNSFDPVRDWLDPLQWDGVARLDGLAAIYLGAQDTPIHRAYARCWMISGVARVFAPGCQADHTIVLVGPQGQFKSSFLRAMAVRPAWFTDSLPSLSDRKASAEVLLGKWIVEHAELDQLGRAELSTAKAWLTAREDTYRAAYARRASTHPRRSIFAATTNEVVFLRDATGARRFWPIRIGTIDLSSLERDLEQLWAEAVHLFRTGEPWHLSDPTLIEAATATQEGRFQHDAWEPLIAAHLRRCTRIAIPDVLKDALELKPERWDQSAQNRVARCLQHLGWERRSRRDSEELEVDGKTRKRRWAYERATGASTRGDDVDE